MRSDMLTLRLASLLLPVLILSACASEPDPAADSNEEAAAAVRPEQYVGVVHPPVPDSVVKRGGALAMAPGQPATEAQYAFEDVRAGATRMLWLSELQGRNADGRATWRVIDALGVPPLQPDERLLLTNCRTPDRTGIAAIAQDREQEVLTNIRRAWAVDRAAGQIVEVDASAVECENEGIRAP